MGLFAAFLSAIFSTSKDLLSKRLTFRLDGMSSTFASFAYALPFYVIALLVMYFLGYERFEITQRFLLLVFLRSLTDSFAEGMKMHALAHGDLSMVSTFFSISPLLLLITYPLITRETLAFSSVAAVMLVVGGSLLMVYRPGHVHWTSQKKAILLAVGASLFFSFNTSFDRLAVQEETPVFSGFAMTFLSALMLTPMTLYRKDRRQGLMEHWGALSLRGLLEVIFMVSKLTALQYMDGPDYVAVGRISVVLSIIAGRVLFKEPDFKRRLAAGLIIVAGVVLVVTMRARVFDF